jgi:hypothetical protein
MAGGALVTGDLSGLEAIIELIQQFAYYIALAYSTWGLIEYSMDNPSGLQKAKRAVIGYIGIFVLPVLFDAIRKALG